MGTATSQCTRRQVRFALALSTLSVTDSIAMVGEQPSTVQITVDALRGDLPARFSNVLGDGGFRYLMAPGIHHANA